MGMDLCGVCFFRHMYSSMMSMSLGLWMAVVLTEMRAGEKDAILCVRDFSPNAIHYGCVWCGSLAYTRTHS